MWNNVEISCEAAVWLHASRPELKPENAVFSRLTGLLITRPSNDRHCYLEPTQA